MPELPEVETVRRGIAPHLEGARIIRFEARRADLRTPLPRHLAARVTGRRVLAVRRRAKYLLIDLEAPRTGKGAPTGAPEVMIIHLGMSGRLLVGPDNGAPPGPHEHIAFATDRGTEIRFSDPRRFGVLDLLPSDAFSADKRFAPLGPEPLAPEFDAAYLEQALAGSRTTIKAALLDQHRLAGVGNIYACEALFQAGISPRRQAGTVRGERAARLVAAIKDVLARAIAAGGSSARDYVQASGEAGWFQHAWAVYDREGTPCPGCDCGRGVRRIVQGGRSTFYCASRQR
ncbi:MAG: bifunctional DNA-formamidopyrimidine glycosylase/DNA-(apurinic or apyrimidinic site) lyase [Alphaproteobacteria bacterium]|nr:bifunctional DNA-formamidopyrimidine glycosylase/DNA-(apurinic or apyrimidinic site) lyase [Alphaproteobacteria bacterium]